MRNNQLISGLDIGSDKTRLVVAQIETGSDGYKKVNVISLSEVDTEGFTKGNVSNVEYLVSTISSVLEKAEITVGLPIENVCVGIAGDHIISKMNKGVVAISKANNEIGEDDIERAVEIVRSVAIPPNYENLHIIPVIFNVDNQIGIKNPIGMTGVRLEVEVQAISGLSTRINNFTRAIHRTSLEMDSLVFSILSTSEAVLNKKQKELGVLLLDIGHTITKGAIFEDEEAIYTFNIPIGSSHITADLAIGLRSSIETAEIVKKKNGTLDLASIRRTEQVDLSKYENSDKPLTAVARQRNSFSKKYINEIIEARVDEIFSYVVKELKKSGRFGKLPAGVVLTGGGSKLPYLVEYAKDKLALPVSLGYPTGFASSADKIYDLNYATVCGLIMWGVIDSEARKGKGIKINFNFFNIIGKIKKMLKILMP
ncbi:MAG: cell division protein FtsA [Patescibacteria group bacterium]|nr:cell division protein FtsA [Patescibacteria group bacterium]